MLAEPRTLFAKENAVDKTCNAKQAANTENNIFLPRRFLVYTYLLLASRCPKKTGPAEHSLKHFASGRCLQGGLFRLLFSKLYQGTAPPNGRLL